MLPAEEAEALALIALAAMDSEPVAIIDRANLDYLRSGADADVWPPEREEMGDVLLYRHAQPAPVVPDEKDKTVDADDHPLLWSFNEGWNACRSAMLAASTQSPGSEPATVPGKWIPVSERMPEKGQAVLVYRPKAHEGGDSDVRVAVYGRHNFEHGFGCYWEPSHWMPLPAAPQEVR
ncbi:DUF551 domain-containing protein [Klebsiella pneumoniae]|nr:DUF551 domain-containing protein [Klebsiella pneumoniae]MBH1955123.1 DUF551 domain-containing protein [Klebsiella pneumoniae]TJY80042.1 DUF551 domain-containing protein [Klebsiella pneumoniae]TJY82655.1 DUF551 domain-containing protein [Klebsiella pneumoniae]TJY86229.1 DUF551 domain-containing protein [Klebsiella pneumoniae]